MNGEVQDEMSRDIIAAINKHTASNGQVLATVASILAHCTYHGFREDEECACDALSDYLQFAHLFMHMTFEHKRGLQ